VYRSVGDAFVFDDARCAVNVFKRSCIGFFEGFNRRVSDFLRDPAARCLIIGQRASPF
jgi:hypothetical protein